MTGMNGEDVFELARPLRPQTFGDAPVARIDEPIVEPMWIGLRVLAAARDGVSSLFDDGVEVSGQERLLEALAATAAATSQGVILDGFVTKQVAPEDGVDGDPGTVAQVELPSAGSLITRSMFGVRRNRAAEAARRLEQERAARTFGPDEPVSLVVTDLLWLDGEWLLDIPLAERKRLLGAVIPGSNLVRPSAYVRPPIQTWIGSWRSQGFTGLAFKAANSRYRPGQRAADWTSTAMPRR